MLFFSKIQIIQGSLDHGLNKDYEPKFWQEPGYTVIEASEARRKNGGQSRAHKTQALVQFSTPN